jgi:hypothetical protein
MGPMHESVLDYWNTQRCNLEVSQENQKCAEIFSKKKMYINLVLKVYKSHLFSVQIEALFITWHKEEKLLVHRFVSITNLMHNIFIL